MLEIVLARPLVTRFHRQLVTPEWVAQLREFLGPTRLRGQGRLQTEFGDERYMGPESVVKYRFHVSVYDDVPELSPIQTGEAAFVEYQPKRGGFKLFWVSWWWKWRHDVLRQLLPPGREDAVYSWDEATQQEIGDLVRVYAGVPRLEGEADLEVVRAFPHRERGYTAVRFEEPAVVVAVSDWAQARKGLGWLSSHFDRRIGLRVATQEQVDAILAQREG